MKKIARLRRQDAIKAMPLMEVSYGMKRAFERARGGMIILAAFYGSLCSEEAEGTSPIEIRDNRWKIKKSMEAGVASPSKKGSFRIDASDALVPHMDVTVAIQCLVENSKLIVMPQAARALAWLHCFFDPDRADRQVRTISSSSLFALN